MLSLDPVLVFIWSAIMSFSDDVDDLQPPTHYSDTTWDGIAGQIKQRIGSALCWLDSVVDWSKRKKKSQLDFSEVRGTFANFVRALIRVILLPKAKRVQASQFQQSREKPSHIFLARSDSRHSGYAKTCACGCSSTEDVRLKGGKTCCLLRTLEPS